MLGIWLKSSPAIALGLALSVAGFLLVFSWPLWSTYGIVPLGEAQWYPYEGRFGLLAAMIGTAWAVGIGLMVAVPCGVAAAVVTVELLPRSLFNPVRMGLEMLAGIPSVIHGLIGIWLVLPWLERTFGLLSGHSLLAAGLILAMMTLPTVTVLSQEAFLGVPSGQRETAMALGLDWSTLLLQVLIPQSWPGIRSAILVVLGRALGETMAVMLVVGSVDRLPSPLWNLLQPAQTLTSRIGREVGEAAFGSLHFAALMGCASLLALAGAAAGWLAGGQRE